MKARYLLLASALSLPLCALAEQPNIEPGMWENENHITFETELPLPDQNETTQECITAEQIASGEAFMGDVDEEQCDVTNKSMSSDAMSFDMSCNDGQGMEMTMSVNMSFAGDTAEGEFVGEMQSPMGPIKMRSTTKGRRIGDC